LVSRLEPLLEEVYHANAQSADYEPDATQSGQRALRNTALALLVRGDLIVLDGESAELTFTGVANRPVPSLFRGFSAPVNVNSSLSQDDQLFLARHDSDPFNRWQALQDVAMRLMVDAARGRAWPDASVAALAAALGDTIAAPELDKAFKAHTLTLPPESEVARMIGTNVDPDRVHAVRDGLVAALVARLEGALEETYHANAQAGDYVPDAAQSGRRALRNTALSLLVRGNSASGARLASQQYGSATNMTDRLAALSAAVASWTAEAPAMLGEFRTMYAAADPLVLDKWLALNATPPHDATLERVKAVLADPTFPANNPNRLRSLVGTFAMNNAVQFARPDGAGFRFVAEFVADVDKRNPQVAARVLTAFRTWKSFEAQRQQAARDALHWLSESGTLSRNTADILARTLEG
jgi:aminopeptidase N